LTFHCTAFSADVHLLAIRNAPVFLLLHPLITDEATTDGFNDAIATLGPKIKAAANPTPSAARARVLRPPADV
jgi:hypothetical protein